MVLFNSITCFVVFFCNSLRDFCVSFLMNSTCLAVFSCNSLRTSTCLAVFCCISLSELLIKLIKVLYQHHEIRFRFWFLFSGCVRLTDVKVLDSDEGELSWFLLVRFLSFPLAIWLSLVLVVIFVSGWILFLLWFVSLCQQFWESSSLSWVSVVRVLPLQASFPLAGNGPVPEAV
jgi:hypothetical protein